MTAREWCLAAVLAPQPAHGTVVVLKGSHETPDETPPRWDVAKHLSPFAVLAEGNNTWEEAQWAVQQAERDLTIVTSAYHQLRAFLSVVRALELGGLERKIRVWNRATLSSMIRLNQEWEKVRVYQYRGHCAMYADARRYLEWRDNQ